MRIAQARRYPVSGGFARVGAHIPVVRALVTSSRLPFALEQIRKLGRCGHTVYASDTFRSSPGNHSRHTARGFITASPTFETARFLDDLEEILCENPVDRLIPAFEEVFYIARHRERFAGLTELFFADFATLRRLHDKVAFLSLAEEIGLRVPPTRVAKSLAELEAATREFPRFFARPAYSRGGVTLFTNTGPLAGAVPIEECEPTETNPFVVQPFVEGLDLCTYSVVQRGHVAAHVTYVHPMTLEHAGGIVFESVVEPETLEATRRIVEATGYHGQISIDFLRTEEGLVVVECNPRPTAGLTVMPDGLFDVAIRDEAGDETLVAPAGERRKLSLAILRNMVTDWREIPQDLEALVSAGRDIYADPRDIVPMMYQLVAYSHILGYRMKTRRVKRGDLMQGYFYDICWNGDEIL